MTLLEAFKLALQHYQAGRLPEAAEVCRAILAAAPDQPETHQRFGVIEYAAGRLGIAVCNVPDYGTTDVADHAIAMLLTLTRGTAGFDEAMRRDPVAGWKFDGPPLLRRLRGLVFGVVGLGRIGLATALRAEALGSGAGHCDP